MVVSFVCFQGLSINSALRLHGSNLRIPFLDTPCSGHKHLLSLPCAVLCGKLRYEGSFQSSFNVDWVFLFILFLAILSGMFSLVVLSLQLFYSQVPERL